MAIEGIGEKSLVQVRQLPESGTMLQDSSRF